MMKVQTQGLCGDVVTVREFNSFSLDIQSLTTLTCIDGDRSDVFDAEHARRKGVYALMRDRVCPRCPRRRPS